MKIITYLCMVQCLFFGVICQNVKTESKLFIRKCRCPIFEIESNDTCVSTNSSIYVQIWDTVTMQDEVINLSNTTEGLVYTLGASICPRGSVKRSFEEWAYLSKEGQIIKSPYPATNLYCIENSITAEGLPSQRIEMCIEKTKVPLCCGVTSRFQDESGNCGQFSRELASYWPDIFNYIDYSVNCTDSDINLHTSENSFDAEEIEMYIESFAHQKIDFCLGAKEGMSPENQTFHMVYKYCNIEERQGRLDNTNDTHLPFCCVGGYAYHTVGGCMPLFAHHHALSENIEFGHDLFIPTYNHIYNLECKELTILFLHNISGKYIFEANGSLTGLSGESIGINEYCLGDVVYNNVSFNGGMTCLRAGKEIVHPCMWRYTIIQTCLFVSSLFFIITLIVYLGVKELRKKMNGACLISQLISLLISQITLLVLQIFQENLSLNGCLVAGVIEIISVLASFFWLNVMCYGVWKIRLFRLNCIMSGFNWGQFGKYSLYAWGIPFVVGIVALIFEKTDVSIKPNFTPQTGCFFTGQDLALQWGYMYGFISLILLVNLGFFIHLAMALVPAQKEHNRLFGRGGRGASTKNSDCDTENVKLYLKLFIIMGFPWIIEVFTSFAPEDHKCYIWFLDTINALRGILIFIIFVCKKKTIEMVTKAWCPSNRLSSLSDSTTDRSRKTSLMSLSSFMPQSRKTSKASVASGIKSTIEEEEEP